MTYRAVPFVLPLLALLAWAAPAAAQIPGLPRPRPGGQPVRPQERPAPRGEARDTTPGRSAPDAQGDTLVDRLLRLQGYTPVEYKADSAEFRGEERTLRLRGNPQVSREGQTITSRDSIVYRERTEFVAAYGDPEATGEGEPIVGDVMYYYLNSRRGTVLGARTKVTDNATWFVEGDVTQERGERIYAANSTFTSDDREDPAYHFRADKIMIIRNRILVGRPAYLYFKNVPVMALPFIVQDLEQGRRSGFLIPQFEINDIIRTRSSGNERGTGREISNIGYYWAINQYLGLEVAGRWRSGSYSAVRGGLGFNWRRRFLGGSVSFENFWQNDGPTRFNLNGNARWDPNERTNLQTSLDFATSSEFERNRETDPFRQSQDISSTFALTRRLDWGNLTFNAERRQSLSNDDVTMSPRFSLSVNPITLFPSASRETARFYNDVVLNVSLNGSQSTVTPGEFERRRLQPTETADVGAQAGLTIGNLGISTNATFQRQAREFLSPIDSARAEVGVPRERLNAISGARTDRFRTSIGASYQQTLIASTRISPSISFDREFIRVDSLVGDRTLPDSTTGAFGTYVAGPPRLNVGATLNTDIYGFFPGFANYSAVRHHVKPTLTWTYSPAVEERDSARARIQRQVFGRFAGSTTNRVQLSLDQTFEAKLRDPEPVRAAPGDSALSQGNAATPTEPRKVTLLSINTSALSYSFEDLDSLGTRFQQEEISNSIRSDLLGGVNFSVTHDLFDDRIERLESGRTVVRRGSFSPFLTSFNTSLTLGANSALFRWLGFSRATEEDRRPERGQTPDSAGVVPGTPQGGATFTGNNQQAGAGPWSLSLNYSLSRQRRSAGDTIPGFFDPGNQEISGGLSFFPTRNWAVNWRTGYSLTDGKFHTHVINLKRDLYRWQANFDYIVAPNGNTSFSFSVHLIDLPDLKADYNERNLGTDRPETDRRNR